MARIEVEPAGLEHIAPVAERMRQADQDEVMAASGQSPREALEQSVTLSYRAWVASVDGDPLALLGMASRSLVSGTGIPWLLGTDAVESNPMAFLRASRRVMPALIEGVRYMENRVDARNELSVRWLRWLGFTLEPAEPWGVAGLPFHRFWMRNDHV